MCASVGRSNTAAQASGQRSVVRKQGEVLRGTCGNAGNSSTRGVEVAVCVLLEWLQNSSAQEVRIYCTAVQIVDCEVSRESGTYSDSVISELVADQLIARV